MNALSLSTPRFAAAPPSAPTRRACEAARLFGLDLEQRNAGAPTQLLSIPLPPGAVAAVTGPSGAGKSTLLRALRIQLRARGWTVIDPHALRLRNGPAIDLITGDVHTAMRTLTSAGLGEARCFIRRPGELSDGQRFRLRLAVALSRAADAPASRPVAIVIDEFAATLDRLTARGLCLLLRRLRSQRNDLRMIVATGHDDVIDWIEPDATITIDQTGRAAIRAQPTAKRNPQGGLPLRIERGALADYDALAHTHYRAKRPARPALTLRAVLDGVGEPIGILVAAAPTLSAPWRELAWPGRFNTGDPKRDAARLNRELRTIARVVVDPRLRGLGVATRLVRAYLDDPLTPLTEAAAAMGAAAPFFQRAGMTAYPVPPAARHARLLDALRHAGVEPWRLAMPRAALLRATSSRGRAFIERELRHWANESRATRRLREAPLEDLFPAACRAIASVPIGYAATHNGRLSR